MFSFNSGKQSLPFELASDSPTNLFTSIQFRVESSYRDDTLLNKNALRRVAAIPRSSWLLLHAKFLSDLKV